MLFAKLNPSKLYWFIGLLVYKAINTGPFVLFVHKYRRGIVYLAERRVTLRCLTMNSSSHL